jgi:hypothetical protein
MPTLPRPTDRDIFINCPFDERYKEQLNALLFTIYQCGFYPRCALEVVDSGQLRFQTICQLILNSPYAIHDLSRIELDQSSQLPRFNMALELGVFLGANLLSERQKPCLVMDTERYRYQRFCSDLSGFDHSAHGGDILQLICVVRDWLRAHLEQEEMIPGGEYIFGRYKTFLAKLPELCARAHQNAKSLTFHELKSFMEGWIQGNDWRGVEQAEL